MSSILDVGPSIRSEALPRAPGARRATRVSIGDPPGEGDEFFALGGPAPGPARPRLPRVLQGVRVLVVDDNEDTAALFAAALTTCGAEVETANNAPDALRQLASRGADVVVSDIAMPGADGFWLVGEIRRLTDDRLRNVPVVAVTAFGREYTRARTLAAGFVDHLEKPLDPEVLCLTVARARRR
jgi:CheY-like chemotaxis protein